MLFGLSQGTFTAGAICARWCKREVKSSRLQQSTRYYFPCIGPTSSNVVIGLTKMTHTPEGITLKGLQEWLYGDDR